MTFDDGILTIYKIENTAQPGQMPVEGLTEKDRYYYGFDTLGINRFYTALQAQQQIEAVVNVPGWEILRQRTSARWITGISFGSS